MPTSIDCLIINMTFQIHQVNWTYNESDVITMDEHVMEGYKERYALYRPYQGDWYAIVHNFDAHINWRNVIFKHCKFSCKRHVSYPFS